MMHDTILVVTGTWYQRVSSLQKGRHLIVFCRPLQRSRLRPRPHPTTVMPHTTYIQSLFSKILSKTDSKKQIPNWIHFELWFFYWTLAFLFFLHLRSLRYICTKLSYTSKYLSIEPKSVKDHHQDHLCSTQTIESFENSPDVWTEAFLQPPKHSTGPRSAFMYALSISCGKVKVRTITQLRSWLHADASFVMNSFSPKVMRYIERNTGYIILDGVWYGM